jgi:alkanesulfonate monooxygenase SsuD/methylene tetrahydromethanopterin reductase-like flavin-dependent oxidoreductase (luciferase family)
MPSPDEAAAHPWSDVEREHVARVMKTHVIGDQDQVVSGLSALEERTGADELIISTRVHSLEARKRSLELVAEAWAAHQPAGRVA